MSDHQHAPQRRPPGIDPARAAPSRTARRARPCASGGSAARDRSRTGRTDRRRAISGMLANALKRSASRPIEKIGEIDRHQDRQREQESDQQLLAAAGIFGGIAVDHGVGPQMTADVGGEPEPVEADGDEFQPGAARDQTEEFAATRRKTSPASAAGTGEAAAELRHGVSSSAFTDQLRASVGASNLRLMSSVDRDIRTSARAADLPVSSDVEKPWISNSTVACATAESRSTPISRTIPARSACGGFRWCRRRSRRAWRRAAAGRSDSR